MSIELCVLGSGSSGNCSVLRTPGGAVLVDAGLGPRIVAQRLSGTGTTLRDIRAICLTHLDRDHFNGNWIAPIVQRGIRVFVHSQRMNELIQICAGDENLHSHRELFSALIVPFGTAKPFDLADDLEARAIKLAHDRDGSHGFVIEGFGTRVGYATDLGHVPARLIEHFEHVDLLALESNYDPAMQESSGRPWFLQRRITGGAGHLSNAQAFEAIRTILDRAERSGRLPEHIVLLHRSRQCNCPRLVREVFHQDARVAARLTLSDQHRRTEWLRLQNLPPARGEQLLFAWPAESNV